VCFFLIFTDHNGKNNDKKGGFEKMLKKIMSMVGCMGLSLILFGIWNHFSGWITGENGFNFSDMMDHPVFSPAEIDEIEDCICLPYINIYIKIDDQPIECDNYSIDVYEIYEDGVKYEVEEYFEECEEENYIIETFYYRILFGDTLYLIAVKFGSTVEILQEMNNIRNSDEICAGAYIRIPSNE